MITYESYLNLPYPQITTDRTAEDISVQVNADQVSTLGFICGLKTRGYPECDFGK